jgi:tRNA threonylcarbamoyladenosine biosynthesis protein TsaE
MKKITLKINTLDDLKDLSKCFVQAILADKIHVLFLDGDLGAGKTTLTKQILADLGYHKVVSSPSFNIMKEYHFNNHDIYHFDLCRLENNIDDLGFEEIWYDKNALSIIEWAQYLPEDLQKIYDLKIAISLQEGDRLFELTSDDNSLIEKIGEDMHEYLY